MGDNYKQLEIMQVNLDMMLKRPRLTPMNSDMKQLAESIIDILDIVLEEMDKSKGIENKNQIIGKGDVYTTEELLEKYGKG